MIKGSLRDSSTLQEDGDADESRYAISGHMCSGQVKKGWCGVCVWVWREKGWMGKDGDLRNQRGYMWRVPYRDLDAFLIFS